MCLTSTETMRLIRDGKKRGEGGMKVEEERDFIPIPIVTTRMTSALGWSAMRTILCFINCEGQSHKTVSTDHNF